MSDIHIQIDLGKQQLSLLQAGQVLKTYPVSTASKGAGERIGSYCTPRGRHEICAKFGADQAPNTVFVAREPTGEVYGAGLAEQFPGRDWILTRILWLSGLEAGRNAGGEVDTKNRHIYIHGAPDNAQMGTPGSIGCIRMHNADVIDLFERVDVGTEVLIHE